MSEYVLPVGSQGYEAGTVLREVTLAEARAMECNRCGDCCDGMRDGVKKDEDTGLPLLVWGRRYPSDFYEERYGEPLIRPIVLGDGGPVVAKAGAGFELDADGVPYTAFSCAFLEDWPEGEVPGAPESGCRLMRCHGHGDPKDISTVRPRSCGEFPVFGLDVDATIIDGHGFVPPVGALPRCTWYGLRVVGPWKDTPAWSERWERQQAGEDVPEAVSRERFADEIAVLQSRRATVDGSRVRREEGEMEHER